MMCAHIHASRLIPAHRAIYLPWVHAYADQRSLVAGRNLNLMVSSSVQYDMAIWRVAPRQSMHSTEEDVLIHSFPPQDPIMQPIHPGSYIHAPPLSTDLHMMSVSFWIKLLKEPSELSGVISQCNVGSSCPWAITVAPNRSVGFHLAPRGQAQKFSDHDLHQAHLKLLLGHWCHIQLSGRVQLSTCG